MVATWQDPIEVVERMTAQVQEGDGCVACGYSFHYLLEGCDLCVGITALLDEAGLAHTDSDRS